MRNGKIVLLVFVLFLSGFQPSSSARAGSPGRAESRNVELVGHLDIEGGGMVDVHNGIAYIGHMEPPYATSILDVSDPVRPEILSRIEARSRTHSHKARACGNILIINFEQYSESMAGYVFDTLFRKPEKVGLGVFDVSDLTAPRELAFFEVSGVNLQNAPAGVHRFEFDCERKLAYISATADGYRGNIVMVLDLSDPAHPTEAGRWWLSGQYTAGGEKPSWRRNNFHVHHPNRLDDRLYVPLWFGGFAIVDIESMANPKTVTYLNPNHKSPIHTAVPVAHEISGKRWLIIFDEDISDECEDPPASMWMVDITDERNPSIVSQFTLPEGGKYSRCDGQKGKRFGAHQPHEKIGEDNLVYSAWFSGGLRIIDISDPYHPKEAGHYVPKPVSPSKFPQTNDVFVDEGGLIYIIDRYNGLDILRFRREP
ncbi:MAG: hypothetical protein C4520_08050 [Candidatus Abyssobacteria bacterium SURF_5]|uniref:Uncharacterized protein n=1 Tax=Abyssobacteria bacterium (strain SURF_5) TaxID=2093360 RepID=A0A3A4NUN1_ABYX5|nr:MAG: hypothetical protein C4520_08050 [Candidatus Abyssubacteria bacterium SURF_5]